MVVFVFLQNYKKQALLFISVLAINLGRLNNFMNTLTVMAVLMIVLMMTQIITMLKTEEDVIQKYME